MNSAASLWGFYGGCESLFVGGFTMSLLSPSFSAFKGLPCLFYTGPSMLFYIFWIVQSMLVCKEMNNIEMYENFNFVLEYLFHMTLKGYLL